MRVNELKRRFSSRGSTRGINKDQGLPRGQDPLAARKARRPGPRRPCRPRRFHRLRRLVSSLSSRRCGRGDSCFLRLFISRENGFPLRRADWRKKRKTEERILSRMRKRRTRNALARDKWLITVVGCKSSRRPSSRLSRRSSYSISS